MIAEVRTEGYSRSLELLRSSRAQPAVAQQVLALIEDRRLFWARFDAEFPDRVRTSLDNLRHELTSIRKDCAPGTPMDNVLVALAQTIRHFFDEVERFDLVTLRCDSGDAEWRTFESALRALRKSVAFQVFKMAEAYEMPLSGEFAEQVPRAI